MASLAAQPENGHAAIASLVEASAPQFAALSSAAPPTTAPGTVFDLGFIADQDQDSKEMEDAAGEERNERTWTTAFGTAKLAYVGGDGDGPQYTFEYVEEVIMSVGSNDDDHDKANRGAEYSLLEWFGGKLVTSCDRTGNFDEIIFNPDPVEGSLASNKYIVRPVVGADGERVRLLLGDGQGKFKTKGLKTEWSTVKVRR